LFFYRFLNKNKNSKKHANDFKGPLAGLLFFYRFLNKNKNSKKHANDFKGPLAGLLFLYLSSY
jgi:hypothetical protein